jgi:hypothetical protein
MIMRFMVAVRSLQRCVELNVQEAVMRVPSSLVSAYVHMQLLPLLPRMYPSTAVGPPDKVAPSRRALLPASW